MKKSRPQPAKLKRTLETVLKSQDTASIVGALNTLVQSSTWNIVKGILSEEMFTHENAMRSFLRKSNLAHEAAYELGAMEAFEHMQTKMIPEFITALVKGKAFGLVEDDRPDEELLEVG